MSEHQAPIDVVVHDRWARVTLARPHVKNAINAELANRLERELVRLGDDETIDAIVLGGAGGSFCSGIDIGAANGGEPIRRSLHDLHRVLYDLPVPLIAGVERFAINAGVALALAADLIVVGDNAFMQVGEIRQGMAIPMNAAWLRVRSTEAVAMRLALNGDRVGADELFRLGLVTSVVPDDTVVDRAGSIAAEIAGRPAGAGRRVKRSIVDSRPESVADWLPPHDDSPSTIQRLQGD